MAVREVGAEAVFELLKSALSEHEEVRSRAENGLQALQDRSGFFVSLAEVASAGAQVPGEVRWLSMVCLKNAVPRTWRRTEGALSEEERQVVRRTLFSMIGEPDQRLATQVSVAIAQIARLNCPEEWPELLPGLIAMITDTSAEANVRVSEHALSTLHLVLKEFASRRLYKDRKIYERVAGDIMQALLPVWEAGINGIASGNWQQALSSTKMVMKCIRELLAHGLATVEGNPHAERFFVRVLELPQLFLRGSQGGSDDEMALSKLAVKCVIDAQNRHSTGFRQFLAPFLDVYATMLLNHDPEKSSEKVVALGCTFVKNVVQCPTYRRSVGAGSESDGTPSSEANTIVENFFTVDRCSTLIKEIIARIFVLTSAELVNWDEDPEGLVRDEETADWNSDKLRPIAESLYVSLLSKYRDTLVYTVLKLTESVPQDNPLLRDACHRAIGRGFHEFKVALDFPVWFRAQLQQQLTAPPTKDMASRVAKARAAWLVGHFVSQIHQGFRAEIYSCLVPLLSPSLGDLVISLTALGALHALVDDLDFDGGTFAPFFIDTLTGVFHLARSVSDTETLRELLQFTSTLVERSPQEVIAPHVAEISNQLMVIWDSGSAGGSQNVDGEGALNLVRNSVALLLQKVIETGGREAVTNPTVAKFAYPIIDYGTRVEDAQSGAVYLLEDALDLWLAFLQEMGSYTPEMSALFPNLVSVLERDFDNLKRSLDILVAYCAVGGVALMQVHGMAIRRIFAGIVGNVRSRQAAAAADALDSILQMFPQEATKLMVPVLARMLTDSMGGKEDLVVAKAYSNLLARTAVQDYDAFVALLLGEGEHGAEAARKRLLFVVRDIIDKADMHYETVRKKASALALLEIMARNCGDDELLQELPLVLNIVVQVLSEVEDERNLHEDGADAADRQGLVMFANVGHEDERYISGVDLHKTPSRLQERRRAFEDSDYIRSLNFEEVSRSLIEQIRLGNPSGFEKVVATASPYLLKQLKEKLG